MAEKVTDLLVHEKLLTPEQAQAAQEAASARQISPVQYLFSTGQLGEEKALAFFAKKYSIPAFKLSSIGSAAQKAVPLDVVARLRCIPYAVEPDGALRVALADPADLPNVEKLQSMVTQKVIPMFTTFSLHEAALKKISARAAEKVAVGQTHESQYVELEPIPPSRSAAAPQEEAPVRARPVQAVPNVKKYGAQVPVMTMLNEILTVAISKGASDVHIEPQPKLIRVRFRLEGSLFDVAEIPVDLKDQVVTRAKVMSNLDISEHRVPQDGRTSLKVGSENVSFRVNTLPTLYGESLVFRVLRQGNLTLDVSQLGFSPDQLKIFRKAISLPNGLVLVTGPTGSGKTTTLYSALAELNHPSVKITTVEDPVEYNLEGITQVQVNKDAGLDFSEVLKGILRQDPDIILVGEIRDHETASVAIQAALTGHLIFSSLHTNDAPSAVVRLLNMGVEPFVVLAAVSTVVAERLLRKVCPGCAKPANVSERQFEILGADRRFVERASFMKGTGCDRCLGGGYLGRSAIFEVLDLTDSLKELILKGENQISIRRRAIADGMKTLRQSALQLAAAGATTFEEAVASTLEK